MLVRKGVGERAVFILGFYGCTEVENGESSWQLLQRLGMGRTLPWVYGVILVRFSLPMRRKG